MAAKSGTARKAASPSWVVLKFGGTSVSSVERWETIAALVRQRQAEGLRPVVVHSALATVSNKLDELLHRALAEDVTAQVAGIREPVERPGAAQGRASYWGLGWALNGTGQGDIAHHKHFRVVLEREIEGDRDAPAANLLDAEAAGQRVRLDSRAPDQRAGSHCLPGLKRDGFRRNLDDAFAEMNVDPQLLQRVHRVLAQARLKRGQQVRPCFI